MTKKRKNLKLICILTLFILINISMPSLATTKADILIETNKEYLEKGEEIELTINIEGEETAAYNFELYFDKDKLEYVSNLENTNIKENKLITVWYDEEGGNAAKTKKIEKYIFRAKENGIANFTIDGEFYNKSGQLIETNSEIKQIQIGKSEVENLQEESILQKEISKEQGDNLESNNANLKVLRVDREGLIPSFETNIYNYYLTVSNDVNDLEVACTAENPNADIKITGNNNLKEGLNNIEIEVTSEDKTQTNNYKIEVTKTADLELANANLQTLAIENAMLNPAFDNNITHYTTEVSNSVNNLRMLAIPENERASVEIIGGTDIKEGKNEVRIIVLAQNASTKKEFLIDIYKRNQVEEEEYVEKQSHISEELEKAYEIETTSSNIENEESRDLQQEEKNSNISLSIVIVIGIILLIFIGIIIYKKYIKK